MGKGIIEGQLLNGEALCLPIRASSWSADRANNPTCQHCATASLIVAASMPLGAPVMKSAFVLMTCPAV